MTSRPHWFERIFRCSERRILTRNAELRGRHAGRRCFVIGNGPSLRTQDLALLATEVTFVTSGFWKHPVVNLWQPTYYCFVDPLLFDRSPPMLEFFTNVRAKVPNSTFLAPLWAWKAVREEALLPWERTYFLKFGRSLSDRRAIRFDLTAKIPRVTSVVQAGMMAAIYMGCTSIYLLGLDHDWLSHRGTDRHFYEGKTVENHQQAHGELSRYSYKELMEFQLELWRGYERIRELAVARGVNILNATDGGFLDVFDRVSYLELIGSEPPNSPT
jgi:hypothetical protein